MNPFPLVLAEMRRSVVGCTAVIVLLAIAVCLALVVGAQERALRTASARAADRFDLVIGAPGSPTQLILTTVYLQHAALDLIRAETLLELQRTDGVQAAVPVAVTDSYQGHSLVGTTAAFATDDGKLGPSEGRSFERPGEALVGAAVSLPVGARIRPAHGSPAENIIETHDHDTDITIVGRLAPTGTPWDRAIMVPIETIWAMHARPGPRSAPEAAATLGPPWSPGAAGPVSAIVVKPRTVGDAYRLRQQYRGRESVALFPAEVLNPLYSLLGNVSNLLRSTAIAFNALLMAAVLLVIAAVVAARRDSIGALRALGAPPAFVFAVVWLQGALLVAGGAMGGIVLGAVLSHALSATLGESLGLAIDASIRLPEVLLAAGLLALGSLLAALPSLLALRKPVRNLLQAT